MGFGVMDTPTKSENHENNKFSAKMKQTNLRIRAALFIKFIIKMALEPFQTQPTGESQVAQLVISLIEILVPAIGGNQLQFPTTDECEPATAFAVTDLVIEVADYGTGVVWSANFPDDPGSAAVENAINEVFSLPLFVGQGM